MERQGRGQGNRFPTQESGRVGRTELRPDPPNAEASEAGLAAEITPDGAHFLRTNFGVPALDPSAHALVLGGAVAEPVTLSLSALARLPQRTLTVTLECAGNNRASMAPLPPGEPWAMGAVSTARWTGVPLRELLEKAVLRDDVEELYACGADAGTLAGRSGTTRYERSLPLEIALEGDALLALEMNGRPVPAEHGGPLRLIVPGWYGMASVKWLTRLEARTAPFGGYFQTERYVYVDPQGERRPVTRQRVKSLIHSPSPQAQVGRGRVLVRGWAWSGGGAISSVEVAAGGGDRWQRARLLPSEGPYAWTPFEAEVELPEPGRAILRSRAQDASSERQPDAPEWNALGYGNNAVQAVVVHVL